MKYLITGSHTFSRKQGAIQCYIAEVDGSPRIIKSAHRAKLFDSAQEAKEYKKAKSLKRTLVVEPAREA